jgi:hypothetical protein
MGTAPMSMALRHMMLTAVCGSEYATELEMRAKNAQPRKAVLPDMRHGLERLCYLICVTALEGCANQNKLEQE